MSFSVELVQTFGLFFRWEQRVPPRLCFFCCGRVFWPANCLLRRGRGRGVFPGRVSFFFFPPRCRQRGRGGPGGLPRVGEPLQQRRRRQDASLRAREGRDDEGGHVVLMLLVPLVRLWSPNGDVLLLGHEGRVSCGKKGRVGRLPFFLRLLAAGAVGDRSLLVVLPRADERGFEDLALAGEPVVLQVGLEASRRRVGSLEERGQGTEGLFRTTRPVDGADHVVRVVDWRGGRVLFAAVVVIAVGLLLRRRRKDEPPANRGGRPLRGGSVPPSGRNLGGGVLLRGSFRSGCPPRGRRGC